MRGESSLFLAYFWLEALTHLGALLTHNTANSVNKHRRYLGGQASTAAELSLSSTY
jgi:hypothetical protein